MKLKTAAMFGLDARIALAIFGALSVISGAALYSVIQEVKVTSLMTTMNEIGKAWDQYYLDTGTIVPKSGSFQSFAVHDLVESSGPAGYKGPYLSYKKEGTASLRLPEYFHIQMAQLINDNTWGIWSDGAPCAAGDVCSLWIMVSGIQDESIVKKIDEKLDGGDGATSGKYRYKNLNSSPHYIMTAFNYAPLKNPH